MCARMKSAKRTMRSRYCHDTLLRQFLLSIRVCVRSLKLEQIKGIFVIHSHSFNKQPYKMLFYELPQIDTLIQMNENRRYMPGHILI